MKYNGSDKWKQEATKTLNRIPENIIKDVKVNDESVVDEEGIANVNVPVHVSDLDDADQYVLKAALKDYYKKNETYSKEEVNNLVDMIPKFAIEVVTTLPTTQISNTTIYLIKTSETETGNLYTEYIYVNGSWEVLGTQKLDLTNYYTKQDVDDLIYEINEKINECFQSVSNGKKLIAGAITDKGVETSATDTFYQMAQNISSITGSGSGNISFDVTYTFESETVKNEAVIIITALCYPDKGRTIKIYVNDTYLGDYSFEGANIKPEMLSLYFLCSLQEGTNTIRLLNDTEDIILLTIANNDKVNFPVLTSTETTVDGLIYKVTASSVLDSSRLPYMPFNGTENLGGYDCWHPTAGAPQWLMLELPYSACIKSFTMQNRQDYVECPKDVIFQGSTDGKNWDDIHSFVFNDGGERGVTKTVETNNVDYYKFYRWYIETVNYSYGVIAKIKDILIYTYLNEVILQYIV